MLEPTRKPPTDSVELCVTGPAARVKDALAALEAMGFTPLEGKPWREVLPHEAGDLLAGARHREGLTQVRLAELTGIPRRHISEMENNRRPIGKQNARKLAEALHIDPRRLLTV